MRVANRYLVLLVLISAASGCSSIRHAQIDDQQNIYFNQGFYVPGQGEWSLENLRPDEGAVLVDGVDTEVSIDMRLSGPGIYQLWLSHDNDQGEPYEISITERDGDDVAAFLTPKWKVPVQGLNEDIIVSLYSIHKSETGKTISRTLLKQIKRRYYLICNKDEFKPVFFIKKILNCCREQH